MQDTLSATELSLLLQAASDFSSYPGLQTDESAKQFLDKFPLPLLFRALQSGVDVPGLPNVLISCLERIFKTKYGASIIPQYTPFVQAGLQSNIQTIRCFACKAISFMVVNADGETGDALQLITGHDMYPLLLDCLIEGDEVAATAAIDTIVNLVRSPGGIGIVFPRNSNEATNLKHLAAQSSSLARIRILSLIVKLFSISNPVASAVYDAKLLDLLEEEVKNPKDILTGLSALELLYELAESPHGTEFLLSTSLLYLLASIIRNTSLEPISRSRAFLVSGRLLSSDNIFTVTNESGIRSTLLAIDARLVQLKDQDVDESDCALEALGQIGASVQGATLLLSSSSPVARHVVDAAFYRLGRGKQLAALHALANISGEMRSEGSVLLNDDAEECLRCLVYATAASSSKLTPSGLFLSVLQQDSDVRLAAYRMLTGLVARQWCLLEVCSKRDIINIVTDVHIETTKNGMEARYRCCTAINKSLSSSKCNDDMLAEVSIMVQEAVRRGPYLAKARMEAQPIVKTAERF